MVTIEVRCDGKQIHQARYFSGHVPMRGEMVQVYDRDVGDGTGGWFRVREVITVIDNGSTMNAVHLVCDREVWPVGLLPDRAP